MIFLCHSAKMEKSLVIVTTLLVCLSSQVTLHQIIGECNSYEQEMVNEGYHRCVYTDPMTGMISIGVGYNIYDYNAQQDFTNVGANYSAVINGYQCLTDNQVKKLFDMSMSSAYKCASGWLGKPAWGNLTVNPKSAIIDMAFNYHYIGCNYYFAPGHHSLYDFVGVKNALSMFPPDYEKAIDILMDSTWYSQEPKRCLKAIECLKNH